MSRIHFPVVAVLAILCMAGSLGAQDPYVLSLSGPASIGNESTTPFLISVGLANNSAENVSGWSYGVCNDTTVADATAILPSDTNTINDGAMPGFLQEVLQVGGGFTQGVVIDLFGGNPIVGGTTINAANVEYTLNTPAPLGTTSFDFCGTLGPVAVAVVVVVNGLSVVPTQNSHVVNLIEVTTTEFRRGDANFDGNVNIADGVWILNDLFQGGPSTAGAGGCDGANNSNGQGGIDASDAIYIFNYNFLDGPAPPAPFPSCGTFPGQLPAPDDCDVYSAC